VKLFDRISAGLLVTVVIVSLFPSTIASADTSRWCWRHKRAERRFAHKINVARTSRGRVRMNLDKHLSRVARKHSRAMDSNNRLYHSDSGQIGRRVTHWRVLGENVGVGGSVKSLHQAFMNSPAHRDNILYSAYRHVGVGVRKDGNTIWVTVVFESRENPGTTLSMPRC
jgi:uncharacterized protein YkwD